MKKEKSILMGMPSGDTIVAQTAMCFTNAAFALRNAGYHVAWLNTTGTLVDWNQYELAMECLEGGHDYLWLIDSDMFFAGDVGIDLIRRDKDIVGCDYRSRKAPREFTTKFHEGKGRGPELTHTSSEDTGCREVNFCATGMLMIRRRVFEKMPPPWFRCTVELTDGKIMRTGNDANFCIDAQKHGFHVWCDFYASRKVAHIGQFPLFRDMAHPPAPAHDDNLPKG